MAKNRVTTGGDRRTTTGGDVRVQTGTFFDDIRQAVIDGLDLPQLEAGLTVSSVVRTSDNVVTVTFDAIPSFDIASLATVTQTVPAAALAGGIALVATPTFTIDVSGGGGGGFQAAWARNSNNVLRRGRGTQMIKNTASQRVGGQMVTAADGTAFTGAVTVAVTVDAGTQATGSVGSGACTHEGAGYHTYAPAQAETNGDLLAFTFTGTGAVPATVQVYTVAGDPFTRLGAPAGASVSADVAAMKVDTAAILVDTGTTLDLRIPAALVSGRMDASVGAMAANVLTATAINADAITAAKLAADVTTEIQTGLATAANLATVAGYLDTEIAAILADTNELQTDWVNGGRLDLILDIVAADTTTDIPAVIATLQGFVDTEVAAILADTNELQTDWANGGRLDVILDAAGSAGDPWTTALPGAYGSGTAGKIIGDNINATISSRASQTTLDTLDNLVDTEVADIKTVVDAILVDTAEIGAAGAGLTVLATQASVTAIDDLVDTEVAAIKTVVDAILVDTGTTLDLRIPAALVSGRMDASVGAMAANVMTAAAAAADLTTELQSGLATASALTTVSNLLDTEIAAILADTNELQTDWVDGGRLDLVLDARASQTSVNAVDDYIDTEIATISVALDAVLALLDDARTEPAQGAPPVNPDAMTKLDYLYKAWRNKKDNDGTTTNLYADNGSTIDHKQATSEAAGTVTKAEWITGA